MLLSRRDALAALFAVRVAARQPAAAEYQEASHTEVIACGWDEVFILALGDGPNPTHRHPSTGRIVYIQAEAPNWWAERLHFQRPDGTLRLPGERVYKARWA